MKVGHLMEMCWELIKTKLIKNQILYFIYENIFGKKKENVARVTQNLANQSTVVLCLEVPDDVAKSIWPQYNDLIPSEE